MAVIAIDNREEGLLGRLRRYVAGMAAAARHLHGHEDRTTARPGSYPDLTEPEVVRASGDLSDWRAVRELNRRCEQHLRAGPERIVLDLSDVEQADSKLVASLVLLARRARSARVAFEIRPSSQVSNWITLCRVDQNLACLASRRPPKSPSGGAGVWSRSELSADWKTRIEDALVLA